MASNDINGYADVNGLHMYYEVHGKGTALVLLHAGMLTIDLSFSKLLPALSEKYKVIAVEMQGHGRTADIDREITPQNSAKDVIALLDKLGVERAHVLGHSMGAAVTIELGVNFPDRVVSLIPMSATVKPDGLHEDLTNVEKQASSNRMPTQQDFQDFTEAYKRLSPHPEKFDEFLKKLSASNADILGWNDEQLSQITAPVLHIIGDRDFTTIEHAGYMLDHIPNSQLAVLPNTTHMQVTRRDDVLLPLLSDFLS